MQCSICLQTIHKTKDKCTTSCNHHFHSSCMFKWTQENNKCPLCRNSLFVPNVKTIPKDEIRQHIVDIHRYLPPRNQRYTSRLQQRRILYPRRRERPIQRQSFPEVLHRSFRKMLTFLCHSSNSVEW